MNRRATRPIKRLVARVKTSEALRRVIIPFVVRFPTLLQRLATLAQRFSQDIVHPDWPAPLPATYLHLPLPTRAVLLDLARAARREPAPTDPGRPHLAWVAPQPPDAAQAVLLEELGRHYQIDLIAPARDSGAWFDAHHAQFARIVYHVANTALHGAVLRLLARHPGIVVLQDVMLGVAVADMAGEALPQALFHAHGYTGLLALREHGEAAVLAAFPLNRILFDKASGIIVDVARADAIRSLAQALYGPRSAAALYAASVGGNGAAIEDISDTSPQARYRRSVHDLAVSGMSSDPRDRQLIDAAQALAASQPGFAPRQLLIDISAVAQNNLKTGIQRVVRSLLLALIKDPPAGFRVEAIYGSGVQQRYRYARRFTFRLLGCKGMAAEDDPITYQDGDIFLCPDLSKFTTMNNLDTYDAMRARGVSVYFVVHDILPLLQPDVFSYGAPRHFGQYILAIARHADGAICVSRAVADELGDWLAVHDTSRAASAAPFKIGYFHNGADFDTGTLSEGMTEDADQVLAALAARPSFLMVGTLEPRKAHAQALAAFERLWQDGADVNLVIVGKQGWMAEALTAALRNHPQQGKKLFWLSGMSDQMLIATYRLASALLAASLGEGFGLPLIEAAQHGLPIIARDIPVFREVCGEHAFYFDGLEPAQLADAIMQWLTLSVEGRAPRSAAMPWQYWSDSARQLCEVIVDGRWYRTVGN